MQVRYFSRVYVTHFCHISAPVYIENQGVTISLEGLPTWEEVWRPQLGAELTSRNSHESVTVSMTINAQPDRSINENLLWVFFINIWLKMHNLRCILLCRSDDDEFTKSKFKITSYLPQIHNMRLLNLFRNLCCMTCALCFISFLIYFLFWINFKKISSFGRDCWILRSKTWASLFFLTLN